MQCRWRLLGRLHSSHLVASRGTSRVSWRVSCSHQLSCKHQISRFLSTTVTKWQQLPVRRRRKDTHPTPDTIYALSSAAGRAAIAIVRISGPACLDIYGGLCPDKAFPHPRYATLRKILDPDDTSRTIDTGALVFYFPAPKTVTGEDVLEFHVHGGPAVVRSLLEAIPRCTNTRPRRRTAEYSHIRAAEPGEFTKRAFYNGRLDLTQAEALGETLAAETEQQHRLAIAGAAGGLAARYEEWRKMLLHARGELEALIDFSEDQHFDESPKEFMASVSRQVTILRRELELHVRNASRGELLRSGISVALLGAPNAGKSSLLNRIVGREAAIVSSEAGTTRDIVDVSVDISGWLVRLGDMAGLRGATALTSNDTKVNEIGAVEQEGIRRAKERALQSDLVIALLSLSTENDAMQDIAIDPQLLDAIQLCQKASKTILFVVNKTDLVEGDERLHFEARTRNSLGRTFSDFNPDNVFFISCIEAISESAQSVESDPGNIQSFLRGLTSTFASMTSAATGDSESSLTPQEAQSYWATSLSVTHRQAVYLKQCLIHLDDFIMQNVSSDDVSEIGCDTVRLDPELSHHIDGHDDLVGEVSPHEPLKLRHSHAYGNTQSGDLGLVSSRTDDLHSSLGGRITHDEAEFDIVTAAEHLRYAAACLAKITGRGEGGDVEDVLGVVFEN